MPDIPLIAKRYDGQSGSTTFTGCIPLKPGQLFETTTGLATANPWPAAPWQVARSSLRALVSLWRGTSPGIAEVPAYITALYPQHPDGSIKVLRVSTILPLAPDESADFVLKLGTNPTTIASPTSHPVVDGSENAGSLKFPRLLACTDAAHLCQSRVAPYPLIPLADPRLSANLVDYFTNQWENGWTTDMEPSQQSGSFPTFKIMRNMLLTRGDLHWKLCTIQNGSNIITNIRGGWPLPTSAPTALLTVGMRVGAGPAGYFPEPGGTPTSTISAILGPNSVQVTIPPSNFPPGTGDYVLSFGYKHPAQDASYNMMSAWYYRYLMTGNIDHLREAHLLSRSYYHEVFGYVGSNQTSFLCVNYGAGDQARYDEPYTDENGVLHATAEIIGLDEYGEDPSGQPAGLTTPQSGFHVNAWMNYVLSGWDQALGVLIRFGNGFLSAVNLTPFREYPYDNIGPGTIHHSPSAAGGWDGPRMSFRIYREHEALYYMLSLPFGTRKFGGSHKAPTPRLQANKDKYLLYFKKRYFDSPELWSTEFNASNPSNGWMRGRWGISPNYVQWSGKNGGSQPGSPPGDTTPPVPGAIPAQDPNEPAYAHVFGAAPTFQLEMMFNSVMIVHCNIIEGELVAQRLGELADWLCDTQISPLDPPDGWVLANTFAAARPGGNPPVFRMPYRWTDPALLANPPIDNAAAGKSHWHPANLTPPSVWVAGYHSAPIDQYPNTEEFFNRNFYTPINILALLAYGHRVTGHPMSKKIVDGMSTIYAMTTNPNATQGGAHPFSQKTLGEQWGMAAPMAAWISGENWGLPLGIASASTFASTPDMMLMA